MNPYAPYKQAGLISVLIRNFLYRLFPGRITKTFEHQILFNYFEFYRSLSPRGKAHFIRRVISFHNTKDFFGAEGLHVTQEMPVVLAALALRITMCLQSSSFGMVQRIVIYPGKFPNRATGKPATGLVGKGNTMLISWEDVDEAIQHPGERKNAAVSLWAKVFELELHHGMHFDKWVVDYFDEWLRVANTKRKELEEKYPILTDASPERTNMEILASAISLFFDAPAWMKLYVGDVYEKLCILLNQDPLNEEGTDFRYDAALARKKGKKHLDLRKEFDIKRKFGKRYFHWSIPLMVAAPIISVFIYSYIIQATWINIYQLMIVLSAGGLLGITIFYRLLVKRENTSGIYFLFFTIFFILPFFSSMAFLLNYSVRLGTFEKKYSILEYTIQYKTASNTPGINDHTHIEAIYLTLKNNDLPKHLRRVKVDIESDIEKANTATFIFETGLFGMPVLKDVKLSEEKMQGDSTDTN